MGNGASAGLAAGVAAATDADLAAAVSGLTTESKAKLIAALSDKPRNDAWIAAGYCPLSYFGPNGAHPGSKDAPSVYKGATYLLTNAEVVAMFEADPEKFLPKYGGYCATACSMGVLAPVTPDVYKVVDGKLYLFHTAEAKAGFEAAEADVIAKADAAWDKGDLKAPPAA